MSVLIGTVANSNPTGYGHQRKIDRTSNGVLWAFHAAENSNAAAIIPYYSLDDGETWTQNGTIQNGSGGGGQTYTKNHSIFIDIDDYAHVIFKDASDGFIYYRRGTPNGARTSWTWSGTVSISTNAYSDFPDIIAIRKEDGTGWNVLTVWSYRPGALWTAYLRLNISTSHVITIDNTGEGLSSSLSGGGFVLGGGYSSPQSGSYPSIDFNHTGDGKTVAGGTPHLYVAWSSGAGGAGRGIRFKKATYAGTSWSWSAEVEMKSNYWVSSVGFWLTCMFDGSRVVIAGFLYNGGADPSWLLTERNVANTVTTEREAVTLPSASYMSCGTATYDSSGNYYFIGRSGENKLFTRKWSRATTGFLARVLVDNTIPSGSGWTSAKRGASSGRSEFIYTDGVSSPYSVKYSYVGDIDPEYYPSPVTSTTATTPTAYSNQRKIDRCSNGVIWMFPNSAANQVSAYYSTDNGITWVSYALPDQTTSVYSGSYVHHSSIFVDADDYMHWAYKSGHDGHIYYRRGTPDASRTSWAWSSEITLYSGTSGSYPDLIAHKEGTGWVVHVLYSVPDTWVYYNRIPISEAGVFSAKQDYFFGSDTTTTSNVHTYPSIDFHHNGDGKTLAGSTPHLYMAWSRGQSGSSYGIKYMKGIYSAGSWTWGSVRTISTSYDLAGWVNCLFDGTRILIAGLWYDGVSPPSVTITERDEADTTSINRNPGGSPGADPDYVESGSVSYDNRGNIYLIGLNTTTGKVICRVFDRTSQAWTTDAAGTNRIYGAAPGTTYLSAQRGYANKMITFVYTGTASSPYAVMYDFVQLNRPPSAPTLVAVAGTGSSRNVTWQHNDPEGDPQSKYQLRWRKVV